jgi:hypothetical protein
MCNLLGSLGTRFGKEKEKKKSKSWSVRTPSHARSQLIPFDIVMKEEKKVRVRRTPYIEPIALDASQAHKGDISLEKPVLQLTE